MGERPELGGFLEKGAWGQVWGVGCLGDKVGSGPVTSLPGCDLVQASVSPSVEHG